MRQINRVLIAVALAAVMLMAAPYVVSNGGGIPAVGPVIDTRGVAFLMKTDASQKLTLGQIEEVSNIKSGDLRAKLDAVCAKDRTTGEPERRFWDSKQDVSQEQKFWQDAFNVSKPAPSFMISNGRRGYSGPLPPDSKSMEAIIDQYSK